jgi:hypothetical protein
MVISNQDFQHEGPLFLSYTSNLRPAGAVAALWSVLYRQDWNTLLQNNPTRKGGVGNMNGGVIFGVVLLGIGITMIVTSEGHNVGYITSLVGVLRIARSLGKS